jgi:putative phage-type endonuclease
LSAVLLGTFEHDTPEWHAARAGGIGASEIASVVGLSPYVSAFHLWHKKKGNLPDDRKSYFAWGHKLEPIVRDWFAEQHPELYVATASGTWASTERPWQRCNPDGLIYDGSPEDRVALYEGKTSRYGDGFGPSGSDIIPLAYRCQVQHSLDIFDLPRAYVAVLIGGNEPREYVIEADPVDQAALREAGARFWQSLQDNDEPPIDASFSTYEAVRKLHPEIDGEDIDLDPDLYAAYLDSKQFADETAETHQQIKSRLLAEIGEARRALVDGRPVLRRQPGRNGSVSLYPVKESA